MDQSNDNLILNKDHTNLFSYLDKDACQTNIIFDLEISAEHVISSPLVYLEDQAQGQAKENCILDNQIDMPQADLPVIANSDLSMLVSTPINTVALNAELSSHPDKNFVKFLITGLEQGFDIGYSGPQIERTSHNLLSAIQNPLIVDSYLSKEVAEGRIVGPIASPSTRKFTVQSDWGSTEKDTG